MGNKPKVSIIIPLYNQERYFDACIRSICRQTYSNLQVIIVDDGSTDSSPRMADEWAAKDDRLLVIHKSNEGIALARRDGYLKATGEFVMFVDNDDIVPRNAIATLVDLIITHNVDLVIGSMTRKLGIAKIKHYGDDVYDFPVGRVVKNPELFDKHFLGLFGKNTFPLNMWARIYRKSVIDKASEEIALFTKEICFISEDLYFNTALFPYLNSIYRTLETVYIYRYGGSSNHYNSHYHEVFAYCDMRLQMLDERGMADKCEPLLKQYADYFFEQSCQLLLYKHVGKDVLITFFKEEMRQREIAKRLVEYFSKHETSHKGARLMARQDYEAMYVFAYNRYITLEKSWRHRIKRYYYKLINKFS